MSVSTPAKSVRLVQLVRFFEAGGRASTHSLAEKFGCHQRAIQRDILDLQTAFALPLRSEWDAEHHMVWFRMEEAE